MTDDFHLTAIHPAPVSYVPERGRNERFAFARLETAVSIARVPADGFEPVHEWGTRGDGRGTHRHGGALWCRLAHGPQGEMPMTLATFAQSASGRRQQAGPFLDAIRWTPLAALGDVAAAGPPWQHSPVFRGEEIDLEGARRVSRDGRADAVAALHRHVASDYRVVGPHVYRRVRPLALAIAGKPAQVRLGRSEAREHPGYNDQLPASPGNYAAVSMLLREFRAGGEDGPHLAPWLSADVADILSGEDARLVANAWPGYLRRRLASAASKGLAGGRADAFAAVGATLLGMEIEACMGLCGEADLPRALHVLREGLTLLQDLPANPGPVGRKPEAMLRALSEIYIPGLRPEPIPDADADSIGALAP